MRNVDKKLTDRQAEVLTFITSYINIHGYSPSIREVAKGVFVSKPVAVRYIDKLVELGYISHTPRVARSIVILKIS